MRNVMWFVFLALTLVASPGALAQQASPNSNGAVEVWTVTERERFDFDKHNEDRKARTEIWKGLISGAALLIPLLIGIYSIRAQARTNFELKAAEIVMNAKNVFGVRKRADVLRELFPKRLGQDFADSFDPQKHAVLGPSTDSKLELLKLIVAAPEREQQIVDLWRRMYSGDKIEQLFPGDFLQESKEGSHAPGDDV